MAKDIFDGFVPPDELSGLPENTPILVGFSGGADSRFLLHLLSLYARKNNTPIYAAHLNHGIRGEEAERDMNFCIEVCKSYGIELFVRCADIPKRAEYSGESLELAARRERYEFFEQVMAERNIPLLATAHNADDVLETLLFRIMRGTGTKGLAAIPPVRPLSDGRLAIRPILSYSKSEILEFCKALSLDFVTDSTNLDTDCTRNKIRHLVIPYLEEIAGVDVPQHMSVRAACAASEDDDALSQAASEYIAHADCTKISLQKLNSLHIAVAKRVIFKLYANLFCGSVPDEKTLSATHTKAILQLCRRAVVHSRIQLPSGSYAAIEDGCLIFAWDSEATAAPCGEVKIFQGETIWCEGIKVAVQTMEIFKGEKFPLPKCDCDEKIFATVVLPERESLVARVRCEGDVIYSHGMTKKLKKLMCDKKVPLELRSILPIFLDTDGSILWCPSVAVKDNCKTPTCGIATRISIITKSKSKA